MELVGNIKTGEQDGAVGGRLLASRDDGGGGPAGGFAAGLAGGSCDWTGLGWRSMYVFMVFAFRFIAVWGVSPTTCGSATRFTGRNPRLLRRAVLIAFTFIASHIVQATTLMKKWSTIVAVAPNA